MIAGRAGDPPMNRLSIFIDASTDTAATQRALSNVFELSFLPLESIRNRKPDPYLIFDINMRDASHLAEVKDWLKHKPQNGKAIFVTDKGSRVAQTQAHALGATDVIHRPIDGKSVLKLLWGDFDALLRDTSEPSLRSAPGVGPAFDALENVFLSACLGAPLNPQMVNTAGRILVDRIETHGLGSWIEMVRKHHSQTYQHSLLVTGVAVAFGQHLGISTADRQRLSFAGMLHDIGKARIPVAILEKPGPLDADETEALRKLTEYGYDALASVPGIDKAMLDMVVHHHEYLDGSGYPHGLQANEISDLVRIITISDIFGALIERRSYKPPMSGKGAYEILVKMGPKLDKDLLREFRFASALNFTT